MLLCVCVYASEHGVSCCFLSPSCCTRECLTDSCLERINMFKTFVKKCRQLGLRVMVDCVLNHTSFDCPLTLTHRYWYKMDSVGRILSPGVKDDSAPDGFVTWGDLSEIDNESCVNKEELYFYWWKSLQLLLDCGVQGVRCDAAHLVPGKLWDYLIYKTTCYSPGTIFIAESLGCSIDDVIHLSHCGHHFVFNSAKWWDFHGGWLLKQLYDIHAAGTSSIGFSESHDTERLMKTFQGNVAKVTQHFMVTALLSSGLLMPAGFEFCSEQKLDVVSMRPLQHYPTNPDIDLRGFVKAVNTLKTICPSLHSDTLTEWTDLENEQVRGLTMTTKDGKHRVVLCINLSSNPQRVVVPLSNWFHGVNPLGEKDLRTISLNKEGQFNFVSIALVLNSDKSLSSDVQFGEVLVEPFACALSVQCSCRNRSNLVSNMEKSN
eukprot:GCRY01005746.1.p1 GENE.GCRY01005746.1~~GCRY01005746.1.p1  ORF type:complete len:432 (-),score=9.66 GCRY01005746.1:370-1665(-)